jgi:choline dehydrogenase-like flavoprotein
VSDHDADILIVGGDPAGAFAARCLASAGASVLLLDASHPREKPCGGGLTKRCVAMVGDVLQENPRARELALQVVVGAAGYRHIRRRAVRSLEPAAAIRVAGRQIRRGLGLAP